MILEIRIMKKMEMKDIYIKFLLVAFLAALAGVYTSCTDNEAPNNGKPMISYVRVTAPESSDSLLVAGYQGAVVAIMGQNLQDTRQVWFNDRKASLSPTYITSTTIITNIPSQIPNVISNKMALVFANGDTLYHDFEVSISEPVITTMNCEYVATGGTAVIRGDYFYEPLTVTFTGGVTGELIEVEDNILHVKVPEGAEPGPLTITTNFGETVSDFWFRDNRNIFISDDPWSGWWGEDLVVPGSDPLAINGNFTRMKTKIGSWAWIEMIGGPADALGPISKNIPDDAVLHPADYYLKFEVNTLKPYNGNRIKIMLGRVTNPDPNWDTEPYFWEPPFDTEGEWKTVAIPFEDVVANYADWSVSPDGYGVKIWFHGPGELDADMAFDNFRVVPKSLDN